MGPMLSYEGFFPFSKIREEQHRAIKFALDTFVNKNKKFVVLEMGPGCGKSATGMTIARTLQAMFESNDHRIVNGSCYVLTTQKVLQDQYIKDFGPPQPLCQIKSKNSYTCQFFEGNEVIASCGEIQQLLSTKAPVSMVYQVCEETCTFKKARRRFVESPEGITNYSYFLHSSTHSRDMQRRGLLVLDEAHNVESAVSSFVKVSFSNHFYKTVLEVKTPPVNAGQATVYSWLTQVCRPKLKDVIKREARRAAKITDSVEALAAAKRLETLRRSFSKIEKFIEIYDPSTWVLDASKSDKRGERIYEFKPIVVGDYCRTMLYDFADKVLILSATILDKDVYCESVGIDLNDVEFLRIPSPFDPKNRPVHILPVGSMSKAVIEKTLPEMIKIIKMIMEQHPNDKGIIHCVNYKIAEQIYRELGTDRLLPHTSDDREEVVKFHMNSKHPTVLLSPSMMEGVDLADDASRFQILCKVPFPYLGDAAVQKRMQKNPQWYAYQAVKSVVQALGRSIRNENDHATSYILDRDWLRFYRDNQSMFPAEFSAALIE